MVQATPTQCVVEATIDGLPQGQYEVNVHEYGDLSQGCDRYAISKNWLPINYYNIMACIFFNLMFSCGGVYGGDVCGDGGTLGTISADAGGRATLQTISQQLHVWDLIGRSIVVHSPQSRSALWTCFFFFLLTVC